MLEDPGYTNSIGGSSTKIGSLGVVSLNLPRLAIKCAGDRDEYLDELKYLVLLSAKINHAKRYIVKRKIDEGMHPLYSLGFIDLDKQYSTVGINGLYESLEFMGMDILTQDGQDFVIEAMNVINNTNKKCDKLYGSHANCEQVPKPITVGTINLL
jgi:ribonucleoside-triphosphate reductase